MYVTLHIKMLQLLLTKVTTEIKNLGLLIGKYVLNSRIFTMNLANYQNNRVMRAWIQYQ